MYTLSTNISDLIQYNLYTLAYRDGRTNIPVTKRLQPHFMRYSERYSVVEDASEACIGRILLIY